MKQTSFYRGVGFMMLSAAGMSLVGLFGKLGIKDLTVSALMFWRYAAASLLIFFPLLCLGRLEGALNFRHFKIQWIRAFFLLISQYCFYYYLMRSNLLNATALLNTGPVFIALIDWGILRKKVGVSTWIGTFMSFLGALLILQPDEGILSLLSLVGLLSGVSQGASQIVFGIQSEKEEKPHISILHLFSLCAVLSLIPFLFFRFEGGRGMQFSAWDLGIILTLGVASIVNQLFRAEAYAHGTPSRLSPYLYFAVLLAGVWDWLIFGLIPNWISLVGAAFIVLGGLLKILLRNWILSK